MNEDEVLKCRVSKYCKRKNIAISKFESLAGLSNGYVNRVSKRPSSEKLDKIKTAFPDLNIDWLLTGEGEMLKSGTIQQAGDNATQVHGNDNHVNNPHVLEMAMTEIAEQRKLVAKSQEQIDRLITLLEKIK